jgi:hypothetical protein
MRKLRALAFILSCLFVWWNFLSWLSSITPILKKKKEYQFREFLEITPQPDCIIVFNSGGWGCTSLEKETDFRTIVLGIQSQLEARGHKSAIVPYQRAKESILGKLTGAREIINYFSSQSRHLARQIDEFLEENPDKKVILTGLSMGAFFVDTTMKHVKNNNSVLAIKVGVPFYSSHFHSDRTIDINNERDALVYCDNKILLVAFLRGLGKWISARLKGQPLAFGKAMVVPGHNNSYSWESPAIRKQIIGFLEKQLLRP